MNMILKNILLTCSIAMTACSTLNAKDKPLNFTQKVNVFGVTIVATDTVPEGKLLHAASVMAEYLDNDQDGKADNELLVKTIRLQKAVLVMVEQEEDMEHFRESMLTEHGIEVGIGQDLYATETHPNGAANGIFDATLEEVLHLISNAGYEKLYPNTFSTRPGSAQSNAMDIARGGVFKSIPNRYPKQAWYSYYDPTCDYECQGGEYFYWSLTTLLGAQDYGWRKKAISDEWRLYTPQEFIEGDTAMYQLLSSPTYKIPTVLPNGKYKAIKLEILSL